MKYLKYLLVLLVCSCVSKPAQKNSAIDSSKRSTASESISFDRSDFVMAGPYTISPDALQSSYRDLPINRFGTFEMTLPNQKSYLIREFHYRLYEPVLDRSSPPVPSVFSRKGNVKKNSSIGLGIRALPALNGAYRTAESAPVGTIQSTNGPVEIKGSERVDDFLYQFYGYQDRKTTEPIFALIAYSHPEIFKLDFFAATDSSALKTENGITHLGAYVGHGQTKNSPVSYHNYTWGHSGYPPILFAVNFDGADTKTFNQNALITLKVLNEFNGGPIFPSDYKKDYYRTENLKQNLDFYRAWVDTTWVRPEDLAKGDRKPFYEKLKNDPTWATYCAEHITIALNVALNLPQNLAGYQNVYGTEDGTKLWNLLVEKWKTRSRVPMTELAGSNAGQYEPFEIDPATQLPKELTLVKPGSFKPLWAMSGITSNPFKNGIYNSKKILEFGYSLAWEPETTADILSDYVQQYGDFVEGSPALTAALLVGFSREAMGRMGIDFNVYFKYMSGIIPNLFAYHTAYLLSQNRDLQNPTEAINKAYLGGKSELKAYLDKFIPEKSEALATGLTQLSQPQIDFILQTLNRYKAVKPEAKLKQLVREEYYRSVKSVMKRAKAQQVVEPDIEKQIEKGVKLIQLYSPPAVVYRIANGMHKSNPHVQISAIATVFEAKEIQLRTDNQKHIKYPMQ